MYIDETGIGKGTAEKYRWMEKGKLSIVKVEEKRQKRRNVIAAHTCEGIRAPFTFEGSCNTQLFESYVENVLRPILKPKNVIIMDNASFHKSKKIKELIEAKECELIFSSPLFS